MLSPESAAVVRATLPVVGAAIDDIAATFYRSMFADNPDLLRNLFNRGNQANGEQRKALAGSIVGFAAMVVDRQWPDVMLARIAHKHASLGITSEQYSLVHKYLFGAIAEVLGDAAAPAVIAAWDEVYWLMADTLIELEADLYRQAGDGLLRARVIERRRETDDVISLILRPDAQVTFKPGQYISVRVPLPDGARQIRQYSLSWAPGRGHWRITVKRVHGAGSPDGEVSNWLHGNIGTGDVLTVSPPFGDVSLSEGDGPVLLASAGIGITPILSMVDHLVLTGSTRRVIAVHADRSPREHAHREEYVGLVQALPDAELHRWYEEAGDCACRHVPNIGLVDLTGIDLPDGVVAYLCGPLPFMRKVRADLLSRSLPAANIHYEVFGPDLWLGRD